MNYTAPILFKFQVKVNAYWPLLPGSGKQLAVGCLGQLVVQMKTMSCDLAVWIRMQRMLHCM